MRVKLKRDGKLVRRNGRPVFRRVRRCRKVPSPGCRFVRVKKRKDGKVVKRHGRPVYIKVERCPPKPEPPKPEPPAPAPTPQPGPAPAPGSAEELANRALVMSQHVPANISLFTSLFQPGPWDGFYPTGSAMAPDDRPLPTEQEARAQLSTFLDRRFPGDPASKDAALAIYDSAAAKALIDDEHMLRAALAGLKGTVLEPAIDHLLNSGRFGQFRFGGLPVTVVARSTSPAGSAQNEIVFNVRYRGERLEYLIAIMGHEILHDDAPGGGPEEAVNYARTAIVHMQLLSQLPELAHGGTELARVMNTFTLLFVNTREAGSPNSEIYAPTGLGTAPGSDQTTTDLWSHALLPSVGGGDDPTPPPAPLRPVLEQILTPGTPIPDPLNFDQTTAELFASLNDDWLTDVQRAQISVLLELVTVDEIVQATGLAQQQVIDTLGLQPYLDAAQ